MLALPDLPRLVFQNHVCRAHTVRCLHCDTARDCIGRPGLSGLPLRYPKHLGVHAGAGVFALMMRSDDERKVVLLKIPRCDIDGVGEVE